ncbi:MULTISPECIES: protein kinase domain-containing protein [unclassified Endozoicomonas]|uniref:protein kinase domain-containing protein n=1 Tax=unclassified Endozoicomonas TaxID=2644528 RepID=UPI003BB50FEB
MDGVSGNGSDRPVDGQDQKLPGQSVVSVVDNAEKALPESELHHHETGLRARSVSGTDLSVGWSSADEDASSGDEDSADSVNGDEGFADVEIPGLNSSLDSFSRADEDDDNDIIFRDDNSSGIGSAPTTPGEKPEDPWSVPASAEEKLPRPVSLGENPDKSNATASEISCNSNAESSACETLVVRYSPRAPAKKPWIIRSRSIDASDEEAKAVYEADHHEALLLRSLSSDFIIGFIGFNGIIDTKDYTTELVLQDGGLNMARAITQVLPDERVPTIVSWLYDLARGLTVLKQNRILHRDIKPDNLLVDMIANRLRIADFGNAHRVVEDRFPCDASGSARYSAPEVRECKRQNYSADIYSAGISFVEIMMDADLLTMHTWQEFCREKLPVTLAEPHCQHRSAPELTALVNGMIEKKANRRPWAETIVHTLQGHGLQP